MWSEYISAANVEEVLDFLAKFGSEARIIAGGTDLMLEFEHGAYPEVSRVIDVSRVPGLDLISLDDEGYIHLGPMVTHNQCVGSKLIVERAFPLAQAAWEVGAPQIRNRGTVAGNVITASPANDTITPLMALDARVTLRSKGGERTVPLTEFYKGVRQNVMRQDEMLVDIHFKALDSITQRGGFIKLGLRAAQAIAVVNVACVLTMDGDTVASAAITLGAVAPTISHASAAEAFLAGRVLDEETISKTASLAVEAANPIDDIRGSASYRKDMVKALTYRLLETLANGKERDLYPEKPIMLWGKARETKPIASSVTHLRDSVISTKVNGKEYEVQNSPQKSLLDLLRDDLLLTGSKEGCAEGECGACTVYLDGVAVMSCLVPAARAHGAEITTIESIAENGHLHPVQEAFVKDGAIQCGYCTPGLVMSAVKIYDEHPLATEDEIKRAIAGNLCRCTGYHKIIKAIGNAGKTSV